MADIFFQNGVSVPRQFALPRQNPAQMGNNPGGVIDARLGAITLVNSRSFRIGSSYVIFEQGTTDWTSLGSSSNSAGTEFIYRGAPNESVIGSGGSAWRTRMVRSFNSSAGGNYSINRSFMISGNHFKNGGQIGFNSGYLDIINASTLSDSVIFNSANFFRVNNVVQSLVKPTKIVMPFLRYALWNGSTATGATIQSALRHNPLYTETNTSASMDYQSFFFLGVGGGGGGAGGSSGGTVTNRRGGRGGGAGAFTFTLVRYTRASGSSLDTTDIIVNATAGLGGAGGLASVNNSTPSQNGANGTRSEMVTFKEYIRVGPGNGGAVLTSLGTGAPFSTANIRHVAAFQDTRDIAAITRLDLAGNPVTPLANRSIIGSNGANGGSGVNTVANGLAGQNQNGINQAVRDQVTGFNRIFGSLVLFGVNTALQTNAFFFDFGGISGAYPNGLTSSTAGSLENHFGGSTLAADGALQYGGGGGGASLYNDGGAPRPRSPSQPESAYDGFLGSGGGGGQGGNVGQASSPGGRGGGGFIYFFS